jgi:hypothetical protein
MLFRKKNMSSKPRLNFFPSGFISCRFLSFTIFKKYLYQKEERALPRNIQNLRFKEKISCPHLKCSASHYLPPTFSSLSLSLLLYLKG